MVSFLERHKLILYTQHGFRNNRSCLTNLLEFYNHIFSNCDKRVPSDIIYLDFNKRYKLDRRIERAVRKERLEVAEKLRELKGRAGILLADVSGHRMTDALLAAMLHQAFLTGAYYELDRYGEITTRLFEHINTRFYRTTAVSKYFTMLYGEILERGRFRFISAGHQPPAIFSRETWRSRLVSIRPRALSSASRLTSFITTS